MINEIIKTEYDTTNVDIDLLCSRNGIDKATLPWFHAGYKKPILEVIAENPPEVKMIAQIQDIRDEILHSALNRLKLSALGDEELSTKELKELESIASSIEASIKPAKKTDVPTINILVQNLMDRTQDDC